MAKRAVQSNAKKAFASKAKKSSGYSYIGTISDGVKIIRPRVMATHFTTKQIRQVIAKVVGPSSVKK
jgi:hypothetical protein